MLLETLLLRTTPTLVVQPTNESDISRLLKFCSKKKIPVFPRGTSSSAFGGTVPTRNGIVVDCSPLMSVLEIDPQGLSVRVQPGARWADVSSKLESYGLAPKTTPTSFFSTVAGWISTGGLGLNSYAYGSVFESVLAIRVVRPDGSIEVLEAQNPALKNLFETEGQFGILTEIVLRVRPKPPYSGTCLLSFDSPSQSLNFLDNLSRNDSNPSHVVFFDRKSMRRENILFQDHTGLKEPIVPENEAALLHFDSLEAQQKFAASLNGQNKRVEENSKASSYLWAERYFPLKAQRIGPSLLGTEVVIPGKKLLSFMSKARRLTRHFKVNPSLEVIVCRRENKKTNLVLISFTCDYTKSVHYTFCLLLLQVIVRLATRCGGYPYGIGIWNTPFLKYKYGREHLKYLKSIKRTLDLTETLNPSKFFKIKGRFFGLPALFLHASIFPLLLSFVYFISPVLGPLSALIRPKEQNHWTLPLKEGQGERLLDQSFLRCTSCGSCVSVCPAYHITQNESVTARAKLRVAEAIKSGLELDLEEAFVPFFCLHCGLCEEVCQTRLPLRQCYSALEDLLEGRFGSPMEAVQTFIEELDSRRDFIQDVFGLDTPDWSPSTPLSRVPTFEKAVKDIQE